MSLPQQMTVRMRDRRGDTWGPWWQGTATLPTGAKGEIVTRQYDIQPGHLISIPFIVTAGQGLSGFKAMNELLEGASANKLHATLSKGADNTNTVKEAKGRDTTTDNPFCQFQDKVHGSAGGNAPVAPYEAEPGILWLNLWSDENVAISVPLGSFHN